MTIKGITKPIAATGTYRPPVEDPFGNVRAAIQLNATIDRREWDMDYQTVLPGGGNALGYAIGLRVNIAFVKKG